MTIEIIKQHATLKSTIDYETRFYRLHTVQKDIDQARADLGRLQDQRRALPLPSLEEAVQTVEAEKARLSQEFIDLRAQLPALYRAELSASIANRAAQMRQDYLQSFPMVGLDPDQLKAEILVTRTALAEASEQLKSTGFKLDALRDAGAGYGDTQQYVNTLLGDLYAERQPA